MNPFFKGIFLKNPIMPGVLIIEAFAQAGALAFYREGDPQIDVVIATVKETRFYRKVVPGDQLIIKSEIIKDRGKMILFSGEVKVDKELVAEPGILASFKFLTS